MKKTVKGLIIAASVAAVVGVGAVSYAAWVGNTPTATQQGNTGVIQVLGNLTVSPLTGDALATLYPVDQGKEVDGVQTTLPTGGVTYWGIKVVPPTSTDEDATITYKLKGVFASTAGDAELYWSEVAPDNAAFDADESVKISVDDAVEINLATIDDDEGGYVYMVAGDTDGMKNTITLTFSAE